MALVIPAVEALEGSDEQSQVAREAQLKSPEAVLLREESQSKYAGLSAQAAGELAAEAFPGLVEVPAAGPPPLEEGATVTGYPTDYAASVSLPEGKSALVESTQPMAMQTEAGRREPIDLEPTPAGSGFAPSRSPSTLSIGADAGEGASVEEEGVSLTPVNASGQPLGGAEGEIDGETVFYGGTGTDMDSAVKPTAFGFDAITFLRAPESPEELYFRVGMPQGARLEPAGEGSEAVEVVLDGEQIALIDPPSASDAAGSAVPVSMSHSGDELRISVAHGGQYQYPIEVDPVLESPDTNLTGSHKPTNWHLVQTGSGFSAVLAFPNNPSPGPWLIEPYGGPTTHAPGETAVFGYQTQGDSKIYAAQLEASAISAGQTESELDLASGGPGHELAEDKIPLTTPGHEVHKKLFSLCANYYYDGEESCASGPSDAWEHAHEGNTVGLASTISCASTCTISAQNNTELFSASVYIYQPATPTPKVSFNEISPQLCTNTLCKLGLGPYMTNVAFSCKKYIEKNGKSAEQFCSRWETEHPHVWLGPDTGALQLEAEDPGLGIASFELSTSSGSYELKRDFLEEGKCSGVQCPQKWSEPITYNTGMPEGEATFVAKAKDSAGLSAPSALKTFDVDAKPPTISVGGALDGQEIGAGESKVEVEATDGEGSTPSSGVKSITLAVDKRQIGEPKGSCSPGPCTARAEWPIYGREFSAGKHTLVITAVDNADNVREEEFPFYVHANTPVAAGPGELNPSSGELTLSATDVSLGEGLAITRSYGSRHLTAGAEGPLGPQWKLSLGGEETLAELPEGSVQLNGASGGESVFTKIGQNEYEAPRGDGNLELEATEAHGKVEAYVLKDPQAGTQTTFLQPSGWAPEPTYQSYFGTEGNGSGEFDNPVGAATDSQGDLWVVDRGNDRVEEFSREHVFIRAIGSEGSGEARMQAPSGIAVDDSTGLVYVADQGNHRVDIFTTRGAFVASFTSSASAPFGTIAGLAVDEQGDVWVADQSNDRVDEFSQSGEYLQTLTGTPEEPVGLAFSDGNLYVAERGGHQEPRIQEFNGKGEWIRAFGETGSGAAKLSGEPAGLTTQPATGDLFVVDRGADHVDEFSAEGAFLARFGSKGSAHGKFSTSVTGLAFTPEGALYVLNAAANEVQEWEPPAERSLWLPSVSRGPVPASSQTFSYRSAEVEEREELQPVEELAPQPVGVRCEGRPKESGAHFEVGCRALFFEYDSGTSASGENEGEWGEYAGRLKEVLYAAYNAQTGKVEEKPVARYSYDKQGRLRAEWDPRIEPKPLKTTYGYDEEGLITSLSPPGQEPWLLTYGSLPDDANPGRLLKYERAPVVTPLWSGSALASPSKPPVISGSAQVGVRMSVSTGEWSGADSYSFQWKLCSATGETCSPIVGQNNETFTPTAADAGHALKATVTATNAGGSLSVTSQATEPLSAISTPLYSSTFGAAGSGAGDFNAPRAIARDAGGHLWVADTANKRVQELEAGGAEIRKIESWKNAKGTVESFSEPIGIAIGPSKQIWVLDPGAKQIDVFTEAGEPVRQVPFGILGTPRSFAVNPRSGNFYVGAAGTNAGAVWEYNEEGSVVRFFDPTSTNAGGFSETLPVNPAAMTVDAAGNLWVADEGDCAASCNAQLPHVEEFSSAGQLLRAFGVDGSEVGQIKAPRAIAVDANGDIWLGDAGKHDIMIFGPQGEFLTQFGSQGTGRAELEVPSGIALAPSGESWVLDEHNDDIERGRPGALPEEGAPESPQAGSTIEFGVPVSGQSAARSSDSFHASGFWESGTPVGMAVDSEGDVWAAGLGNSTDPPGLVREYSPQGKKLHEIATGSCLPTSVSADNRGDVFVTEVVCAKVQEFDAEGILVRQWFATQDPQGEFSFPVDTAVDASGRVWTLHWQTKSSPLWIFGENGEWLGESGANGSSADQMQDPRGIAVEASGDVWVADTDNNRIDELSPEGKWIKAIGYGVLDGADHLETCTTSCRAGIAGGAPGELEKPYAVAVDNEGHVYVSNPQGPPKKAGEAFGPGDVQEFSSESGAYLGLYGGQGTGPGDVSAPGALAFDSEGQLWVSDLSSGQEQRFDVAADPMGAPQAMGASEVEAWAQYDDPVEALAMYPPEEPQSWPASGEARASFDYLDGRGRIVNAITPSGAISTSEYNEDNEVTRSLSAQNRLAALAKSEESAQLAERLSTVSRYNLEGTELLETRGPEHGVKLAAALGSHAAGEEVQGRSRTLYSYDEGAPAGEEYGLATKVRQGLVLASGETGEERETTTSYSGQSGLGWRLREPTSVTTDPGGPAGLAPTSSTIYYIAAEEEGVPKACENHPSLEGQVCEARSPEGKGGGSPRDTRTVYYTAEKNSEYTGCGEHPQWQGLVCETLPDKQPADKPALAETKFAAYNVWDEPLETVEEFGTAARRTKRTAYDSAGREVEGSLEATTDKALPKKFKKVYSEATGALEEQISEEAGNTKMITSKLNTWGALESYTDAAGATSTYQYDAYGRLLKAQEGVNGKGEGKDEQAYSYESLTGELTEVIDSDAGAFKASYDLEGRMTSETYPNGMVASYSFSPTGEATSLDYAKAECSSECTIYSEQVSSGAHGEALSEQSASEQTSGGQSAGESLTYSYDQLGRLHEVQEVPAGRDCTSRIYAYDEESDRTSLTTRESGSSQCATSGGTPQTHEYDEAGRLIDPGTTYDALGNTTALPAVDAGGEALTSTYYADSQIASQTQKEKQGSSLVEKTLEYEYDPAGRTLSTKTVGGTTVTSHYAGPGTTAAWTSEGPHEESYTFDIAGIDGSLAAVYKLGQGAVLQIHDLEGDVIGTIADKQGEYALASAYDATEFGVPTKEDLLPASGLGWLGAGGVKTERASGVIAEGGSSYVPEIGRVLQTDFIDPPGADAEGGYDGAPYITHLSLEAVAAELAWGAGAPGREAQRQEEARRKEEEEAEAAAGGGFEEVDPRCYMKLAVGPTVSESGNEWVYARAWAWCGERGHEVRLPEHTQLEACILIIEEAEVAPSGRFCPRGSGQRPVAEAGSSSTMLYAHVHIRCEGASEGFGYKAWAWFWLPGGQPAEVRESHHRFECREAGWGVLFELSIGIFEMLPKQE